ncbi:hypothetical protein Sango_1448400 [Sesamum angolense]|uniref:Uncharacterized protein n=1 Tax=Sesamum angolense TaxID=2727404 RepID=A0AAE1WN19_9LAMI|nr:hypothetical protein Sango_1448400 [Sesamum angolense]
MVGVMAAISRAKLASRINSIKQSGAADIGPKLDKLLRLRDELLTADSVLLVDFLSPILDLLSDRSSPVRKFIIQWLAVETATELPLLLFQEVLPLPLFGSNRGQTRMAEGPVPGWTGRTSLSGLGFPTMNIHAYDGCGFPSFSGNLMIGEIGLKHLELLPDIIPALIAALKDDTPAVARQAITCGVDIFRCSLVKVAIQFPLELDPWKLLKTHILSDYVNHEAVHHQIPLLVRTIGSSRELLGILSDPPTGSEGLVTQVVHTLTDGTVPSPDLLTTIKRLYDTKLKDIDILIPILAFLPKDELPTAQLENALNRTPALKAPLVAHANQPHIRSSLPRSTLVALGLVSEPQTSNQTQPTQTQTAETGNSEMEAAADKSKESSTAS